MGKPKRKAALRAVWSKRERDLTLHYDRQKPDGWLMHMYLSPLLEALKRRGFDETTFKFSICRVAEPKRFKAHPAPEEPAQ